MSNKGEIIGLIGGSFDPITKGHEWLIKKASSFVDKLYVVVTNNSSKNGLLPFETRESLVKLACSNLSNVEVITVTDALLVRVGEEVGANVLFRGIRNATDYEYEKNICNINRTLSNIETFFLQCPAELEIVSSSLIKELIKYEARNVIVQKYVNENVYRKLIEHINK